MRKLLRFMFSRLFITALMVVIQFLFIVSLVTLLAEYATYIFWLLEILAVISIVFVINSEMEDGFKLIWSIIILALPIAGITLYLFIGNTKLGSRRLRKIVHIYKETNHLYKSNITLKYNFENPSIQRQVTYLTNQGFPIYDNSKAHYMSWGEVKWVEMKEELKKAQKFIFMEYFILEEGIFWNSILEILEQKVKEGVEVRVMYDDLGCANKLPYGYQRTLEKKGIKCVVFNPLNFYYSARMNNRDHRKILVIDGNVGFCGGINLADEYINEVERFGRWKDTALLIKGDAVWSLTLMFLQNWNTHRDEDQDYELYKPDEPNEELKNSKEFVLPYGDSPFDNEPIGRNVYMNMINNAKKYLYLTTPYLIIDQAMMNSLCIAAKSGIDVRIITPGIYDKKMVSWLTKDSYKPLLEAGARIYEYTPGFIHAKSFLCDDIVCNVGTINMDYRSFYHHFECSTLIYNSSAVISLKKDFFDTLEDCTEITLNTIRKQGFFRSLMAKLLKLFAPLV